MPEFAAENVVGLRQEIESVKSGSGEQRVAFDDYAAPLLHQGIFLLHKSANVLTAAQDQAHSGMPTWSLATSYQAGLFALDALLNLMGISVVTYQTRHFLIDVWPGPESKLSKKALASFRHGLEINAIPMTSSIHHYTRWAVLQRLLNTAKQLPIPDSIIEAFLNLDDHDFAEQRNDLHYSHTWTFGDIHQYVIDPDLLAIDTEEKLLACMSPKSNMFSYALGALCFFSASQLLKSLSTVAPAIEREYARLVESCDAPRLKSRATFEAASGLVLSPAVAPATSAGA